MTTHVNSVLMCQGIAVNAMVLSAQFWPTFREEKVTLPDELQSSLDAYTDKYKVLKGNRTLCWKPHLGESGWKSHMGKWLGWRLYLGKFGWAEDYIWVSLVGLEIAHG